MSTLTEHVIASVEKTGLAHRSAIRANLEHWQGPYWMVGVREPDEDDDDTPIEQLAEALGEGWRVEWGGYSNVANDGYVTAYVRITRTV